MTTRIPSVGRPRFSVSLAARRGHLLDSHQWNVGRRDMCLPELPLKALGTLSSVPSFPLGELDLTHGPQPSSDHILGQDGATHWMTRVPESLCEATLASQPGPLVSF